PRPNTASNWPVDPASVRASNSHASTAPERKANPRPSSTETSAHQTIGASHNHSNQKSAVDSDSVTVPSRYDARRPTVSATTPVGISNTTMPIVKKALAAKASKFVSPASSRKIVLMPQMNEAASVLPSISVR